MRLRIALPLLLITACSPDADPANNAAFDINGAAAMAQESIDNYAANSEAAATQEEELPAPAVPSSGPVPTPPAAVPALEPINPPASGEPGGLPDDRTPISEAPFTPQSAQGAANVVQTYYALIGEGKYRQAYRLWGDRGRDSGMSAAAFAASFERYSEYRANVGAPGAVDAGAGQRTVTVPVQVSGRVKATGKPFYLYGPVTLHRTVVDGAAPAEKAWHIRSNAIKPVVR